MGRGIRKAVVGEIWGQGEAVWLVRQAWWGLWLRWWKSSRVGWKPGRQGRLAGWVSQLVGKSMRWLWRWCRLRQHRLWVGLW